MIADKRLAVSAISGGGIDSGFDRDHRRQALDGDLS